MKLFTEHKIVTCIASGPSLCDEDVAYVKNKSHSIVVSDCFRKLPTADVLYSCDAKWWFKNIDALKFKGLKFCLEDVGNPDIMRLREKGVSGLSKKWPYLATGGNSGYQAINLAILLGAKNIILLGYDMCLGENGETHWFGEHKGLVNPPKDRLELFAKSFNSMKNELPKDVKITNCSRKTKLTAFEIKELKNCL